MLIRPFSLAGDAASRLDQQVQAARATLSFNAGLQHNMAAQTPHLQAIQGGPYC